MVVRECKFPHVPYFFEEKRSLTFRGKDGTLGSPGLLSQLCKLFRDGSSSTEINETLY